MGKFYRKWSKPKVYETDDVFKAVNAFLPKHTVKMLEEISDDRRVPVSRLIAIAVDNELDCVPPFNYPITKPASEYVEFAYADEASKLLEFIERCPQGVGVDTLLLVRRDLGIENREITMLAYRELLEQGLVEVFRPLKTSFNYGRDYRRVRAVGVDPNKLSRIRYKRLEGESLKGIPAIRDSDIGDPNDTGTT